METYLIALVAAAVLGFGLVSARLEMQPLTPPMVFTAVGLLLAPLGLDAIDVTAPVVRLLAEVTLALVLFTDATRIDLGLLRREHRIALRLLTVGLPLTVVAGTLAGLWLLPGFGWLELALLAAMLAPTDAALGQAVVGAKAVPVRIRQSLNVESGLNDGVVLPLVLILLAALGGAEGEAGAGGGTGFWLRFVLLQLSLGPLVGVAVGWGGGRLLDGARRRGSVDGAFERLASLALALLAFAAAETVGGNGFIAAFAAGLALGNSARAVCGPLLDFAEAEGQLLTLVMFLLFGGVLAAPALASLEPRLLLYAAVSLTAVRMLPVALALTGLRLRPVSVLFLGWFGPRGIASILFGLLALERGEALPETLLHALVLTVLASVLLHGLSAAPAARRYGARLDAAGDEAMPEMTEVPEMPLRFETSVARPDPEPTHHRPDGEGLD